MHATRRHRLPEEWANRVERDGHASVESTTLTPEERGREAMLMGLRLTEGVDPARVETRAGRPFAEIVDPAMLAALLDEDYLAWAGTRLMATSEGRLRLDALLPVLLR
jgi:oxygen-independent coproporphyrinogen-3 oxidase